LVEIPDWARAGRAKWRYTGKDRPPFALTPGDGERSVWDFPRPPLIEAVSERVSVHAGRSEIARSDRCLRVLETGGPPTYYLPKQDVSLDDLRPSADRSWCEWKGEAHYWKLAIGGNGDEPVAWSYPAPFSDFDVLRDHFSFYPGRVECRVGATRVLAQPGGFYGGWITPDLVGPFKGEPGTESL
jgi:uncharacterized protein (DUF427 family)